MRSRSCGSYTEKSRNSSSPSLTGTSTEVDETTPPTMVMARLAANDPRRFTVNVTVPLVSGATVS